MAVATVLIKPGTPNWSLLAKLTLGIAEQMEEFVSILRSKSSAHMARIDDSFFTLVTFQINLHKSLSLYFLSRSVWDGPDDEYGLAIAILNEAMKSLKTRDSTASAGLPDISDSKSLKPLANDLIEARQHMKTLLTSWESDNSKVYFTRVPTTVPENRKIAKGVHMMKPDEYKLVEADLVHLGPIVNTGTAATGGGQASTDVSDEALAREMQEKLNRGEIN